MTTMKDTKNNFAQKKKKKNRGEITNSRRRNGSMI
jgi:hypothetical protein